MLDILYKQTERLAGALALAGLAGLLLLSIMVTADIILRAVADYPLQGVNDIYAMVMAVVIAACIPNSLLAKQNISIEVIGTALGGRMRSALEAFASAAVLLFFVLLAWKFFPYSASISASHEKTWVLQWPVGPWWWVATALFCVSVLAQFMVLLSDLAKLIWPSRPALGGDGIHANENTDGNF